MDWFLYDNGMRHERFKKFKFCPEFFVHVGKRLDKKVRLISNFMT